eukprot:TRINITY_DN115722_c0_g1_i1.p1 TRINITY_DN115722_c0_g1~~TRINITY_DN115722_c0_g1_i1.p1  ORF type:complete len:118 (+),score=14.03 TRINITY_DN115722_c0_g1_i1:395-748(+)
MMEDNKIYTREANYHPCGNQLLYPITPGEPYIVLLGRAAEGKHPDDVTLADFVAFYFDGSQGLNMFANTWHQPSFPFKQQGRVTHWNAQNSVHACVVFDSVDELGTVMEIALDELDK